MKTDKMITEHTRRPESGTFAPQWGRASKRKIWGKYSNRQGCPSRHIRLAQYNFCSCCYSYVLCIISLFAFMRE